MSGDDQETIMKAVRCFYATGAKKLLEYLPFGNAVLISCQFLSPSLSIEQNEQFEQWVGLLTVARGLPLVISEDCLSSLKVEIRLYLLWLKQRTSEGSFTEIPSFTLGSR